jgi:hypothetical protein
MFLGTKLFNLFREVLEDVRQCICLFAGTTMLFIAVHFLRTLISFLIMMTHRLMRWGCQQGRSSVLLWLGLYIQTGETSDSLKVYGYY